MDWTEKIEVDEEEKLVSEADLFEADENVAKIGGEVSNGEGKVALGDEADEIVVMMMMKNNRGNWNELGKCYHCGEQGHYKRDCPKRENDQKGNTGEQGRTAVDDWDDSSYAELGF